MAPEQLNPEDFARTSDRPTVQSDVYSFACVCAEVHSLCMTHEESVPLLTRSSKQLYTSNVPFSEIAIDIQVVPLVLQGRRPSFKTRKSGTESDIGIPLEPLQCLASRCWAHAPEERPHIKEIVSHMKDLQVPWVSTALSNVWPTPVSG